MKSRALLCVAFLLAGSAAYGQVISASVNGAVLDPAGAAVPNAKVRFRDVWIGAFITGLLWKVALVGFSWYMSDMSRFTRVNGSIAAVVVFLVWVYLQAVILLYGVEFTAAYARLRRGRPEEAPAAPTPRT